MIFSKSKNFFWEGGIIRQGLQKDRLWYIEDKELIKELNDYINLINEELNKIYPNIYNPL